MVLIIKNFFT